MRELVLMCAMAVLGAGCVEVVPHIDEYDAGPPDVKPSDAAGEAEVSLGQCTSGVRWTGGNAASAAMTPGRSCLASGCHTGSGAKTILTIGGTVYPLKGERDDDDCNGLDSTQFGGSIEITDETGTNPQFARLQLNTAGNFFTTKAVTMPFRVKLIAQGREIVMKDPVTNGDCNYCHRKDDFMMTKGRIVPPPP